MKKTIVSAIAITVVTTFLLAGSSSAGPRSPYKSGFRLSSPTIGTLSSPRMWKTRINAKLALAMCKKKYPGFTITHVEPYSINKWRCVSKEIVVGSI